MKRPVSIGAAKHLLKRLAEFREQAKAKFPASTFSDRETFALAMLEGTLQYHADPVGNGKV